MKLMEDCEVDGGTVVKPLPASVYSSAEFITPQLLIMSQIESTISPQSRSTLSARHRKDLSSMSLVESKNMAAPTYTLPAGCLVA